MKLLTNGSIFERKIGGWIGTVWYLDDNNQRKRKCFSGKTEQATKEKISNYISSFKSTQELSVDSDLLLKNSMTDWLRTFKFATVEKTTYDRCEATAKNQIYPSLANKKVTEISTKEIQLLLNNIMNNGYAYSTYKKTYNLLAEYFRHIEYEGSIEKNPMTSVKLIKKQNYCSAQGKELVPQCDSIAVFTDDEIQKFKEVAFSKNSNGTPKFHQAAAYILMLNTGLRTGELLGIYNSDIDLNEKVIHLNFGVKEIIKRNGYEATSGRTAIRGKLKTPTSKRDIPLNNTSVEMIKKLRKESYFGEDSPLVPDANGKITKPVNFRKRFYRILKSADIELKGLHAFRHTFATNLVNGIKQKDGSIKSLSVKQVADLLGHSTSQITELYYVKRDNDKLKGITDDFEM